MQRTRILRGAIAPYVACATALTLVWTGAFAQSAPGTIPAGTQLRFHLDAPVSSSDSKTGQTFHFILLEPIAPDGHTVAAAGAVGSGTVYLAGHAGTAGHEGDLTLRLDTLPTSDGRFVNFADQRFEINGRNRKIASSVLGFVPFAGFGARFIRGSEVRVSADQPIETTLLRDAPIANAPSLPSPVASLSPSATPLASPLASPPFASPPVPSPTPSP